MGGRGVRNVPQRRFPGVFIQAGRLGVRANDRALHRELRLVCPLPHGLAHQRDGRSQKQDAAARLSHILHELLGQTQGRDRFPRAAGHDELAAVMGSKLFNASAYSLALMLARLLEGSCGNGPALDPVGVVDLGFGQIVGENADGTPTVGNGIKVTAEPCGGSDDHGMGVIAFVSGFTIECADGFIIQRSIVIQTLALDSPIGSVLPILSDKVDADVSAVVRRGIGPHPYIRKTCLPQGIILQKEAGQTLKLRALVPLGCGVHPYEFESIVYCTHFRNSLRADFFCC